VILADPRVTVDFILDGEHVHPAAVRLAKACKPLSSISLISDSNIGAGFPPGTYQGFGSDEISFAYPGAPARGTENSHAPHALFGSGLTLDVAVKNVIKLKLGRLQEAIIMASTSPAKVLGIYGRKGDLNVGFDADIVRLSPQFEVQETWVSGKSVYKKGEA
jgi:N-acetylglucosamine-6-phosphate deacetylase